jgi:hypothetical protein
MSRPTTIGHNLMPSNKTMSRDDSGHPAFAMEGAGVEAPVPNLIDEDLRGRVGPGRV